MKITEAIILAGGLGTRLRTAVPDLPKCMAPVNGTPFLAHVIGYLATQGISRFILSLGYKHEAIITFIQSGFIQSRHTGAHPLSFNYAIETTPLGTGGAIKLACKEAVGKNILVTNGDTLFKMDIGSFAEFHSSHKAGCSLGLKPMHNFDRYGVVELENNRVHSFKEKQPYKSGLINGGMYVLNREQFLADPLPDKFSFEKDYLEAYYTKREMFGMVQDAYFIDIGIPEDYTRAQTELLHAGDFLT